MMKDIAKNIIIAFLFVLGTDHYFFPDNDFGTGTTLNLFLFLFAYTALTITKNVQAEKKVRKLSYIFSAIYSAALCFGKIINDSNRIDDFFTSSGFVWTAATLTAFIFIFGQINCFFLDKLCGWKQKPFKTAKWRSYKYSFFILWAFMFLMWIPCYLAYYPGIFEYDMFIQTYQAGGVLPITLHHPYLHTLYWKLCLQAGTNMGIEPITLYSMTQMLLFSAILARIIHLFMKKDIRDWLIIVMICFFALNPVIAIFSMIPTKDVLFSAFFLTAVFEIYRFVSDSMEYCRKKTNYIWLALSVLLSCLFRNNALYVFLLCIPFFVVIFRKQWKSMLILFVAPVVAFLFLNGVVFPGMGVEGGDSKEMLSIPLQQIALVAVTHDDELSDETKSEISRYIPYDELAENYNPRFADPVKGLFRTDQFDEEKVGFIKVWFSLFFEYPKDYISAFLSLNLPYWYPDAATLDPYSQRAYIETGITETDVYTFERDSKIPWLLDLYEQVADYSAFANKPVVANLFSIATPFWILLICSVIFLAQERKNMALVLLPGLFLWLTFIAGPVSNFRYILPLFMQYPLLLIMLFGNEQKAEAKKQTTTGQKTKKRNSRSK